MNPILPTPAEMIAHLNRFVRSQARAKQDIAVAVDNHYPSQAYRERENVSMVLLSDRTNDRSLVMTSSFTNLWLAGRILGGSLPDVSSLARRAESLFANDAASIAEAASGAFTNAVYLGSGAGHGAAREAALKMLEMTDGDVPTFAESFLGLRHGPMCALRETTLLVGFLASAEPHRSYERDLLQDLFRRVGGTAEGAPVVLSPAQRALVLARGALVNDLAIAPHDVGRLEAELRRQPAPA